MEKCGCATWVAGTFIVPKKDGRVHWASDFRALNKALKQKCHPFPKIQEILSHHKACKFLSKLDLSMQHHTFELGEESTDLCTVAAPWGLFCHTHPLMSDMSLLHLMMLKRSWNGFWLLFWRRLKCALMTLLHFWTIGNLILFFLKSFLPCCKKKAVNPAKCGWGIQETNFLGH